MSQAKKEGGFYIEKLNLGSKRNVSSTSLSGGKLNFHFKTMEPFPKKVFGLKSLQMVRTTSG